MLTEIGKFLRRYRIDNGLLLKDMAGKLELHQLTCPLLKMARNDQPKI